MLRTGQKVASLTLFDSEYIVVWRKRRRRGQSIKRRMREEDE
jgi:hypothetical protein